MRGLLLLLLECGLSQEAGTSARGGRSRRTEEGEWKEGEEDGEDWEDSIGEGGGRREGKFLNFF